jgi:hypothetical protein
LIGKTQCIARIAYSNKKSDFGSNTDTTSYVTGSVIHKHLVLSKCVIYHHLYNPEPPNAPTIMIVEQSVEQPVEQPVEQQYMGITIAFKIFTTLKVNKNPVILSRDII